ncbi:MAG: sulfatase-like hydrolase/transferase [Chloroflexi bacterium]|nr:sulfatase-like hydrolase/transferase [Chloroflexota bacterium]
MQSTEQSKKRPRVLIIGLDGATFDLIRPWVAQGHLPTFKRLMAEGTWGELNVELPPGTVPNWPSFATGKNPGKHGLIWWVKRDPDTGDFAVVSSADLRGQTMWDIAAQHGLQVGVVNVPVTYPPLPVNGFLISGLLTPPTTQNFTYPEDLHEELQANVGQYRVFPQEMYRSGNEAAYLDDLHHTLETRFQATSYLLQNKPWDLFAVVFGATDWVMHAFWKYHDPTHPYHDPEAAKQYGNAIRSIYEHIDKALAELLELVDENTSVIIMSDHGAGPGIAKSMLNNWLLDIGLLKLKQTPKSRIKHLLFRLGFTPENAYPLVSRLGLLNVKVKRRIDPRRKGKTSPVRRVFLSYNDVDWSRTKAYTFGGMGQIHINVKGRNRLGCVEPGVEYDELCDTIIKRVMEIKIPNSDQSFVKRAYRRDELYHGEHNDKMPDIVLLPSDMGYLDSGMEFFSNHLFSQLDANSGAHRTNGVFMLLGPHAQPAQELEGVSIRDIAPTVLHLLSLPVPDNMDGRVATQALKAEFLAERPIQIVAAADEPEQDQRTGFASDNEEELIRKRLASLGYLD